MLKVGQTVHPRHFWTCAPKALNPDGAVVDQDGCLWNAQWGASRVARYSPRGKILETHNFPARQVSYPAFGGTDMSTLFVTTATMGLDPLQPDEGATFAMDTGVTGQLEHQIKLA